MQIQTERGIFLIEAEYWSEERAVMDGYEFDFHCDKLGYDIYSKSDNTNKKTYAAITNYQ